MTDKPYEVSSGTWEAIQTEVNKLLPAIERGDNLAPDDVKEVKKLVTLVDNASKAYNKALKQSFTAYKQMLNQKLTEIGYPTISSYIEMRRKEQQTDISNRLTAKVARFTEIVHAELDKTSIIKRTQFVGPIPSQMMTLFPKINSGAVSNEIKDWTPIETMVRTLIQYADEQAIEMVTILPLTSITAQTFGSFFKTGDRELLKDIKEILKKDQDWLINRQIALSMTNEHTMLNMLDGILHSDEVDKLSQIRRLLTIWDTRHLYK